MCSSDLVENEKDSITSKAFILKKEAERILDKLKILELNAIEKVRVIYTNYLYRQTRKIKEGILIKYINEDDSYEYFEKIFTIIEAELVKVYSMNIEDDEEEIIQILEKIDMKIIVDNTKNKSPRVIYEENPTLINLIGNVECDNRNNQCKTDLSLINVGDILKANYGCLIVKLNDLVSNPLSYHALKKVLSTGKVDLDTHKNYLDLIQVNLMKPENIPVKEIGRAHV